MDKMKKALVIGGSGFIGNHLVKRLKSEDWHVTVIDLKPKPDFDDSIANVYIQNDASVYRFVDKSAGLSYDRVYQLAADMGGAGFIFTGDNDADVMSNSASINLNVLKVLKENDFKGTVFYSSSACVYSPEAAAKRAKEYDAYPATPDSNYGWEKLFSERLYQAYAKNYGIDIRIARFNNTYGPLSTYKGGREKSPAAICRKVLENETVGYPIEIWGDGKQVREFVYIDDLLDAIEIIMKSDIKEPINIGPETNITIDGLVRILTNKPITHIPGPIGLQVRLTSYDKIKALGWSPKVSIEDGLFRTYNWIKSQYETN